MAQAGQRADSRNRSTENEWRWVSLMIASFVFTPELRRLIDWKVHFSSIDIVSPLPLLFLLPVVGFVIKQRRALYGSPFLWILCGWLLSFGYGVLTGVVQKASMTAFYGFAIYALPVAVGAWVITLEQSARSVLERFARLLLLLGGIVGAYGVFQFIVAPPWDTAWMQSISAGSFGQPVPFGIRVFSVLNGPGVLATFLASVIIMTVTFLDIRKFWELVAVASIFVSLILSMIRTSWLEVILGLAVIAIVHPRRLKAVSNIVLLAVISIGAISAFLALSPDETFRVTLNARFSTFQDLGDDGSAIDRANSAHDALAAALANPQGIGLGASGTAAKLTPVGTSAYFYNADPAIDNGYISRLYETGYFGFAMFIATLAFVLGIGFAAFRRSSAVGNRPDMEIVAVCLAFAIGTVGTLYGGDAIQGVAGVLFFIMAALPCRVLTELKLGEPEKSQVLHASRTPSRLAPRAS